MLVSSSWQIPPVVSLFDCQKKESSKEQSVEKNEQGGDVSIL